MAVIILTEEERAAAEAAMDFALSFTREWSDEAWEANSAIRMGWREPQWITVRDARFGAFIGIARNYQQMEHLILDFVLFMYPGAVVYEFRDHDANPHKVVVSLFYSDEGEGIYEFEFLHTRPDVFLIR